MAFRIDTANFGDTLPNGATFIARRSRRAGEFIVLAHRNGEFVTWASTISGETFWGHYAVSFFDACEDFMARSA